MNTAYVMKQNGRIVAVAKTRKELLDTYHCGDAKIEKMALVRIIAPAANVSEQSALDKLLSDYLLGPDTDDYSPVCRRCGDTYSLDSGYEPTVYCHYCAQQVLDALVAELQQRGRQQ